MSIGSPGPFYRQKRTKKFKNPENFRKNSKFQKNLEKFSKFFKFSGFLVNLDQSEDNLGLSGIIRVDYLQLGDDPFGSTQNQLMDQL